MTCSPSGPVCVEIVLDDGSGVPAAAAGGGLDSFGGVIAGLVHYFISDRVDGNDS